MKLMVTPLGPAWGKQTDSSSAPLFVEKRCHRNDCRRTFLQPCKIRLRSFCCKMRHRIQCHRTLTKPWRTCRMSRHRLCLFDSLPMSSRLPESSNPLPYSNVTHDSLFLRYLSCFVSANAQSKKPVNTKALKIKDRVCIVYIILKQNAKLSCFVYELKQTLQCYNALRHRF